MNRRLELSEQDTTLLHWLLVEHFNSQFEAGVQFGSRGPLLDDLCAAVIKYYIDSSTDCAACEIEFWHDVDELRSEVFDRVLSNTDYLRVMEILSWLDREEFYLPIEASRQVYVGDAPPLTGTSLSNNHHWTTGSPSVEGVWTSSLTAPASCGRLHYMITTGRLIYDDNQFHQWLWLLEDVDFPPVLEIGSIEDIYSFIATYATQQPDGIDWHRVADDWGGVHISMGGFIDTFDARWRQQDRLLRFWDGEATLWFTLPQGRWCPGPPIPYFRYTQPVRKSKWWQRSNIRRGRIASRSNP